VITDKFIRSRPAAPEGKRLEYRDAMVPGLLLRVTDKGHKSFVLVKRYPTNPDKPSRRALGDCYLPTAEDRAAPAQEPVENGALTLAEARAKARKWIDMVARGIDPRAELERERTANMVRASNTFAAVAEAFIARPMPKWAKRDEAKRLIDKEFAPRWGRRPITEITPSELREAIRAIKDRPAPAQARNALGYLRSMFNWAIRTDEYGITENPTKRVSGTDLIGPRVPRARILNTEEIRRVWRAAGDLGYPFGPVIQLMLLTGQREREIADMSWSEVDLDDRRLVIPAGRMKGNLEHAVPLAPMALALIETLPRFRGGDFVFTTMAGRQPISGFGRIKQKMDKTSGVEDWVFHDLRRTARSHFSALPGIQDIVRELVIAHVQTGIRKVYDRYSYEAEKMDCLLAWERRLAGILGLAPVANLEEERQRRVSAQ
jgi:integrase